MSEDHVRNIVMLECSNLRYVNVDGTWITVQSGVAVVVIECSADTPIDFHHNTVCFRTIRVVMASNQNLECSEVLSRCDPDSHGAVTVGQNSRRCSEVSAT